MTLEAGVNLTDVSGVRLPMRPGKDAPRAAKYETAESRGKRSTQGNSTPTPKTTVLPLKDLTGSVINVCR